MELTNPVGRPCEYDPKFCDLVVSLGAEGRSKTAMAAQCGVSKVETLDRWADRFPEFSEALDRAVLLSQAKWEGFGLEGVFDGEGKKLSGTYIKQMGCRYPKTWRDNSGIELSGRVETYAVAKFAEREDG